MNIVAMLHLWMWSLLGTMPGVDGPPPPSDVEAATEASTTHSYLWFGPFHINNGY